MSEDSIAQENAQYALLRIVSGRVKIPTSKYINVLRLVMGKEMLISSGRKPKKNKTK